MSAEREDLIRETKWLKVYRIGEKELRYESKCLSEGLQISASWVKCKWAKLTTEEQSARRYTRSSEPQVEASLGGASSVIKVS